MATGYPPDIWLRVLGAPMIPDEKEEQRAILAELRANGLYPSIISAREAISEARLHFETEDVVILAEADREASKIVLSSNKRLGVLVFICLNYPSAKLTQSRLEEGPAKANHFLMLITDKGLVYCLEVPELVIDRSDLN